MASYYKYTPCPGSTGTLFYSNIAPVVLAGTSIKFTSGISSGNLLKCFSIEQVTLSTPPSPLETINWLSAVYTGYKQCSDCGIYKTYQLVPCCDGDTLIVNILVPNALVSNSVYVYGDPDTNVASCYTVIELPVLAPSTSPFADAALFSLVADGCETTVCELLCLPCECRSFRLVTIPTLPPDYPYDYYPLDYIDCDLTAQVYQIPLDGSWGAPDCMRSYVITTTGIETTSNGPCIVDVSDIGLKSDCPTYYELINCADPNNRFCVTNDLSTELLAGYVLVLSNDPTQCWSIGEATACVNPVTISYSLHYSDCTECLSQNPSTYELINCNLPEQVIYTSTDLSSYIGLTISLTEYPDDCWEVNVLNSAIPSDIPVHVSNSFANCVECSQPNYLLQDCSTVNPELNIITSTDLSAYVGQVITLDSCPGICWQVSSSDSAIGEQIVNIGSGFSTCEECMASMPCICNTVTNNTIGALEYDYIDCDGMLQTMVVNGKVTSPKTCMVKWLTTDTTSTFKTYGDCINQECPVVSYPKRTVRPGYNTPGCSPEEYERIMCNFSEGYYREVMVQAYGITPCCGEDDYLWEIRKELIELKAIEDPNYKCLTLGCGCTTTAYGLTPCLPSTCHNYIVTIPALSSGDLHYLNCQGTPSTLPVVKTKAPYEITICGISGQGTSTIYVDNPGGFVTIQETDVICS
jgi:hypothetical protein